jgi:hypothetical protein
MGDVGSRLGPGDQDENLRRVLVQQAPGHRRVGRIRDLGPDVRAGGGQLGMDTQRKRAMMSDLSGRTTVIVGASRGLGRGIARAFAEADALDRAGAGRDELLQTILRGGR